MSSRVFTVEEISLMEKLGMTPAQVEALCKSAGKRIQREEKAKKNSFLSEYYLKHTDICSLCGGKVVTYFKMTREYAPGGEYLHSIPVSQEEYLSAESQKEKDAKHLTCAHCAENLSTLSHDTLVALTITIQRRMMK